MKAKLLIIALRDNKMAEEALVKSLVTRGGNLIRGIPLKEALVVCCKPGWTGYRQVGAKLWTARFWH